MDVEMEDFGTSNAETIELHSCHIKLQECMQRLQDLKTETFDLHSYQKSGVKWMLRRELIPDAHGMRGGILADEMGLGKTVQMLSLCHIHRMPTLIIAPLSVMQHWSDACKQILGILPVRFHRKNLNPASEHYEFWDFDDPETDMNGVDLDDVVVLASHTCFQSKQLNSVENRGENFLLNTRWGRVIFDEAHVLKDYKSETSKGMSLLRATTRWAVTGTPVVNKRILSKMPHANVHKTNDLRGIVCFLMGNATPAFFKGPAIAIADECEATRDAMILRRTKEDIMYMLSPEDQPPKPVIDLELLDLSEQERRSYALRYSCGQALAQEGGKDAGIEILKTMMQLRQTCGVCKSKTSALQHVVDQHRPGTRFLVFCHWIQEIDKVARALLGRVDLVMKYYGKTLSSEREDIIETFRSDGSESMALIMQMSAGSVGLNLQRASKVYIMSPSWSAAAELQAIGRAVRIDTKHVVQVVRFVMRHTIEEYIHKRQQSKLDTAADKLNDERICEALASYEEDENGNKVRKCVSWDELCQLFACSNFDSYFTP